MGGHITRTQHNTRSCCHTIQMNRGCRGPSIDHYCAPSLWKKAGGFEQRTMRCLFAFPLEKPELLSLRYRVWCVRAISTCVGGRAPTKGILVENRTSQAPRPGRGWTALLLVMSTTLLLCCCVLLFYDTTMAVYRCRSTDSMGRIGRMGVLLACVALLVSE